MVYITPSDFPITLDDAIKSKIKNIKINHCEVPGHQSFKIVFQNGIEVSLIKGWTTFNNYELAIFMNGKMQKSKNGGYYYENKFN